MNDSSWAMITARTYSKTSASFFRIANEATHHYRNLKRGIIFFSCDFVGICDRMCGLNFSGVQQIMSNNFQQPEIPKRQKTFEIQWFIIELSRFQKYCFGLLWRLDENKCEFMSHDWIWMSFVHATNMFSSGKFSSSNE